MDLPSSRGWSVVLVDRSADEKAELAKKLIEAGRTGTETTTGNEFEGKDLSNLDLSNQVLVGLRLRGSNLKNTNFYNVVLYCCDLRESDLSFADLRQTHVQYSSFAGAKVAGARFCRMFATFCQFQGVWWFDQTFMTDGGYSFSGAIPIDADRFGPGSLEAAHEEPCTPHALTELMDLAAMDRNDEEAMEGFRAMFGRIPDEEFMARRKFCSKFVDFQNVRCCV